ncbi:FadR/GntR family transcriptional regulator [Hirschia baltica]|uniref:GntR domain protein n=1 Tax=Hirschia baltica (strain ATCC 49814 / DSM 5838 / IFAM 1418) TaxID=582402 RepID=C6XQG1_HIRBI|nr:FadR/GntR family transcriptional regulator [Hirschia baltica]ACT60460.1 GntR domain protein [Hirschia baltica ATCC 49814]
MKRLYQTVANTLKSKIEAGEYEIGQRLSAERILAEEFNVSRPTIREAIIALEIMGLVEVKNGSGVHVISDRANSDAANDLDIGPFEMMEARIYLESDIAELAATRIDDITLAKLEQLLVEMVQENANGNISDSESADRQFHMMIANATQNSALVKMSEDLWAVRDSSPVVIEMLNRSREYGVQPMVEDHRNIFYNLKNRDPAGARKAMFDHLTRVIDALLEVTETDDVEKAKNKAQARRDHYLGQKKN